MRVHQITRAEPPRPRMVEFADFDSLAACAVMLLSRHQPCRGSRLYRVENRYRLLFDAAQRIDPLSCGEFCLRQSESLSEIAYTEEHGRLLIGRDAVRQVGSAFMKDFLKI